MINFGEKYSHLKLTQCKAMTTRKAIKHVTVTKYSTHVFFLDAFFSLYVFRYIRFIHFYCVKPELISCCMAGTIKIAVESHSHRN